MNWWPFRKRSEEKQGPNSAFIGMGKAVYSDKNFETFSKEVYQKNVIAFRCVDEISKTVASVPWKLFRKLGDGNTEEVTEHPIVNLLKRPNPEEGFSFFMLKVTAFLVLSGNSFIQRIVLESGPNKNQPSELYVLRPDRMHFKISEDGKLIGYSYKINNKEQTWFVDPLTLQCDILQLSLFHPLDDWWGMGPVEPTSREIDTSNEAKDWNKSILQNQGRPGLILTTTQNLTETQFDRLELMLQQKYTGGKTAGKSMILEGGMAAVPYGFSPAELEFLEGSREVARNICFGFGVPSQLIGIPGDTTYSNVKEARLAFFETTIIFYLSLIKGEINNWLIPQDENDLFLDFVLDDVSALSLKRDAIWQRAESSNFLTINEKRQMVGKPPVEGGDTVLISAGMLPIEFASEPITDGSIEQAKALNHLKTQGIETEEASALIGLS